MTRLELVPEPSPVPRRWAPAGCDGVDQQALAAAAREGDRGAFDRLVRATHRDAYGLAVRLTDNEDDARDVVQDAYLRAYRAIGRFRGDARFTTWLYRIVANCAADHLGRRRRHRHEPLRASHDLPDQRSDGDPESRGDVIDLRNELESAIRALPPRLRAVVVLRDVYDLPHDSIAEELGISVSAAKVRLHRARKQLRADVFSLPGEEASDAS